ncbi:MAG: leucine-rich repeat domain-containing protein, partial [Clostridia bacterium]|nr:leucine-rich repeat domain-containing protein [Clostridia bacterium]
MAKEKKSKENIENTAQNGNAPVEEKKQASYRFAENDKNKAREKKKSLEEKYAVKKITPKRIAIIVLICLVAVGIITAGICIGMSGILSPASVKGSTSGEDVGGGGSGTGGGGQGGDVVHDIAYSVSYTSDVGEGKPPMSSNHYKNDKFRLEGCSFTYEGYEFLYWEYNGVYYKANAEFIMPDRNVTFKAVWKKAHDTGFEFELNADGTAYYLKGIGTCEGEEIMLPAKHGDLPVIKILKGAFKNCTFKAVKIADSIVEIGEGAFENCTNLEKIAIPALTQTVGENAFKGCTSLAEVTASDKLLYLGRNSFYNTKWYDNQANGQVYVNKVFYTYKGTCDKTLTLKNDTIAIASFALENQSTVEKVSIPSNVEYIPGNFVSHCDNLASFAVDSGNQKYSVKNNAIILNEEKAIAVGCKATVIPTDGSIDKIWNEAFYGCAALKSIDIPDNVTVICEKAFYGAGL